MIGDKKGAFFDHLNKYFDKIYVITLKRSTDRHLNIKDVLVGLDYEVFWGVDGRNLDYQKLKKDDLYHPELAKLLKMRKGSAPRNLSLSEIGCALSHLNIYKDILNNKYQNALILEDDILIDYTAVEGIQNAFNEMPGDWQLLYLGHHGANSNPTILLRIQKFILSILSIGLQKFERLRVIEPNVIRRWFGRPYSENLERSGYHHGTYAYAVSAEGAKTILDYQTPVVQEIDNAIAELCNYRWLNAFSLKRRVCYPNFKLPSTIKN